MTETRARFHRVMLVDDEENILKALKRTLAKDDYDVEVYSRPEEALRRAQTTVFDLIVADYRMPHMDGVTFLKEAKELQPECARLILSGYADLEGLMNAINEAEIYRFIAKPWQDSELRLVVHQALEQRDLLVENRRLADEVREQKRQLEALTRQFGEPG